MVAVKASDICNKIAKGNLKLVAEMAYKSDRQKLTSIFTNNLSKYFPGGFQNINKVPSWQVISKVCQECLRVDKLATLLLKIWYNNNEQLQELIKKELSSRNYQVRTPDFKDFSTVNLKQEDSITLDTKFYFKTDNYTNLPKTELFNHTLMSILFGWYPVDNQEESGMEDVLQLETSSNDIKIIGENQSDSSPEGETKLDVHLTNTTISIETENDCNPSKSKQQLGERDYKAELPKDEAYKTLDSEPAVDMLFSDMNKIYSDYEAKKSELLREIRRYQAELSLDNLNTIDFLERLHFEVTKLQNALLSIFKEIEDQIDDIFTLTGITDTAHELIKDENTSALKHNMQHLKNRYACIIESLHIEKERKLQEANSLLTGLDSQKRNDFLAKLTNLRQDTSVNKLEYLLRAKNDISDILSQINYELNSYNLTSAQMDILSQINAARGVAFFYKYVRKYGTPEDIFVLNTLFSKIEHKTDEEIVSLVLQTINSMIIRFGNGFLKVLSINFESYTHNFEQVKWKVFGALLAIYAYILENSEIAIDIFYSGNLYEVLKDTPELSKYANFIMQMKNFEYTEQAYLEVANKLKTDLEALFKHRNGRHLILTNGIDPKYQVMESTHILPELQNEYLCIESAPSDDIPNILKRIQEEKYSQELVKNSLKDSGLKKNHVIEKKIEKSIDRIRDMIAEYGNFLMQSMKEGNQNKVNLCFLQNELHEISARYPEMVEIVDTIIEEMHHKTTNKLCAIDLECYLHKLILESTFFSLYAPETQYAINSSKLKNEDVLLTFINNVNSENDPRICYQNAIDNMCFAAAHVIGNKYSYDMTELEEHEKTVRNSINDLKNKLATKEEYKSQIEKLVFCGRHKLLRNQLNNFIDKENELREFSNEQELENLGIIAKEVANIKPELIDTRYKFETETFNTLYAALTLIDYGYSERLVNNNDIYRDILDEVKHLMEFRNEPVVKLKNLMEESKIQKVDTPDTSLPYVNMSLEEIRDCISNDDFISLGLSENKWEEITSNRRDDVIELLDAWLYLRNKPADRETIYKDKTNREEIEDKFKLLFNSLARICSLYRTADKIGQKPYSDWDNSNELPFTFCTKIQQPRCESLSRHIRLFCLTEHNTKRQIGCVKDYITENNLHNSFAILVQLCDKQKFTTANTYKITKNLPVLDEDCLKRIIFSVESNKPPKWEFVMLLTLNENIASIHPFRNEGSINSDIGIFVGRTEIFKEITSNSKDYAIFGGRRIGKTSLLNEIKRELDKNGYVTTFHSLMSNSNTLFVANGILRELKTKNCIINLPLPIDHVENFKVYMKEIYLNNPTRKVAILLDEVDELIGNEKDRHILIEMCRDLSNETEHQIKFIFAGFKKMYQEIHNKGIYEKRNSPWRNFIDDTNKQLAEIESPRELINEGLKNILGLKYSDDVVKLIEQYSSGHPAFLQLFCALLVTSIAPRINRTNRNIFLDDVHRVFNNEREFIKFVYETLDSNLSKLQKAIIFIAAYEKQLEFHHDWIHDKLHEYIRMYDPGLYISDDKLNLELELLVITGVTKRMDKSESYRFANVHYIGIINQFEKLDHDLWEKLFSEIIEEERKQNELI